MNETMIIGLTGQTGAGKSTVAEIFQLVGFSLIDADRIARQVVEPDMPCLAELFDYFGDGIRNADDTLDRRALGKIVFTDGKKLESLNSIMHPYITEEIFRQISAYHEAGRRLILLDAPTLFESKASDFCDMILSVLAPPEIRCERIMKRDSLTREAALERMNSQLPESFFIQHSDYVIRNQENLAGLHAHAEEVARKIKENYQAQLIK
jgi:dephospho-CoA kinase